MLSAYLKSGTRVPGFLVRPETRDPGPILWVRPGTRDPKGRTQDLRPGSLKVEPETWDPGHLFYMGHKTRDPGYWKGDLGHLCYDRWDPRLKINISCRTWDSRTMIQINFIKCPIKIWVIIFFIFSFIIKRLQKL